MRLVLDKALLFLFFPYSLLDFFVARKRENCERFLLMEWNILYARSR